MRLGDITSGMRILGIAVMNCAMSLMCAPDKQDLLLTGLSSLAILRLDHDCYKRAKPKRHTQTESERLGHASTATTKKFYRNKPTEVFPLSSHKTG